MSISNWTKKNIFRTILYISLGTIGLIYVFPFIWMILSSFKLNKDVLAIPIKIIPPVWNFKSYYNAFHYADYNFPRYFLNSIIVAIFAVLLTVILSTTSGYGFAKYKFKGNNILFTLILATLMIPFQAILIPLFIIIRKFGMQDSYLGLIVPEGLTAFGVFMMRQFMYSIPDEIIESARIDGASEYRIFFNIALPIAKTAVFALIIFHVQWVWNLLLWPLVVISTPEMRTMPQAIALFSGVYFTPYPEQLAVSVVACIPILLLYLFLSKNFVRGITLTGLKS